MNTDSSQNGTETENKASGETGGAGASDAAKADDFQTKLQEAEKKYLYLYSEFENFRRRNERDRLDFLKFGHESFLKELLQIMDNFERALDHARSVNQEKGSPVALVVQGIEMIHFQFLDSLKSQGVAVVQSLGSKFNPAFHEAVGEEDADAEPGTVVKEMQKGYLLHGRLLRAARVVISRKAGA
jgi:molecular chaperone GrpE